jgi:hypothetical protein
MPGVTIKPYEIERRTAMFDLMLFVQETKDGLAGALRYNADLFETETVAGLLACFKKLLEEVSKNPACRLLDIPLESGDEERPESRANDGGAEEDEDQFNL